MYRIVSYNIHSGVGVDKIQNYRRIGELLKKHQVDFALLQEMDTRPAERNTSQDIIDLCGDHFTELIPSPALTDQHGWYGNAILSRFPVTHQTSFDVSLPGVQPRNIQKVEITTPDGPLCLINTHKGLKKKERKTQFAMLGQYVDEFQKQHQMPLLLAGDFNEWQFFTRAFSRLNQSLQQQKVKATFPTFWPIFSLDRVWTNSQLKVIRCKVLKTPETRYFSDHYPILIEVETR
jgi:endonuclease/exonuclease/phosphatase family metal-dependent hydrolase